MSSNRNASENKKPVIFLAFSNPPAGARGHLRNLGEEARQLESVLQQAEQSNLCEVVIKPYAGLSEILAVFREYRNRIAVFHYAGHAKNFMLLLEDASTDTGTGANRGTALIDGRGLATFLGEQNGLQFVFLNACSTQPQVEALLAANVSAVVATSQSIRDDIATKLASEFYASLSSGATLQKAFNEAEGVAQALVGMGNTRDITFDDDEEADEETIRELLWPWSLMVKPGAEAVTEWSLPDAANEPLFGLPTLPEHDLPETPFRHLNFFTEQDAELFFGRGQQIRSLYELVTTPTSAPLILFYGESGVGKSSLLAAGLLPRLQDHTIHYVRRDRDEGMIGALAQALWTGEIAPDKPDAETLAQRWHEVEQQMEQPLIIILDQMEELFTRSNPDQPHELNDFLEALAPLFAKRNQRPQGKLILGFRKEWLADIEDAMKSHRLPRTKLFLSRLDRQGIIEAVEGVARSERLQTNYGLSVESGLAEIIADDLLEDPDSPVAPTLQILLTKMWTQAEDVDFEQPRFDIDLYQTLKREGLLLRDFLEQQLEKLRQWRVDVVDSGLVLDLLAAHTTAQGTVEHHTQADLLEMYGHRQADIPALVQKCEDLYLLFNPAKNQRNQPKSSRLAHDALAPLTRAQYEESDRPGQRARRILESRSVEWVDDEGQPIEGNPLDESDLTLVEFGLQGTRNLTPFEQQLLEASRVAQVQRERERKQQRRIRNGLTALIMVAAVVAFFLWQQAVEQQSIAEEQRVVAEEQTVLAEERQLEAEEQTNLAEERRLEAEDARDSLEQTNLQLVDEQAKTEEALSIATSRQLAAQSAVALDLPDLELATLLAIEASSSAETIEANSALRQSLAFRGRVVNSFETYPEQVLKHAIWREDKRQLLTWDWVGNMSLWDASNGQEVAVFSGHTAEINGVRWNQDKSQILTWSYDATLQLWDPLEGVSVVALYGHTSLVSGARWNQDESQILSWSLDGTVRIWDARDGREMIVLTGHTDTIGDAIWNGDESQILTWSTDGTAKVWDAADGRELITLPVDEYGAAGAVWNPDETRILTWGTNGMAKLWARVDGDEIATLDGHTEITSAVWNAAGSRLLTTSWDGTVILWDGTDGIHIADLTGHTGPVFKAIWNQDESRILTWSRDGTARLWNGKDGREIALLEGHADAINDAIWNEDETHILTNSGDNTVRVWHGQTGKLLATLGHTAFVKDTTWSKDERYILTLTSDGTVRQWDWTNTGEVATLEGHSGWVSGAEWNADESRILTWSHDGAARLWQASNGRAIATLEGHTDIILGANWDQREQHILTWSVDGSVRLWDANDGHELMVLEGHTGSVEDAIWSKDESRILTRSEDGTARLWDASDGHEIAILEGHTQTIYGASWNADESRILTWSDDDTVRLWDGVDGHAIAVLDESEQPVPLRATWQMDGTRILSWGQDGMARVWDSDDGRLMMTLGGHTTPVSGAIWTADKQRILTWDATMIQLWDAVDGRLITTLEGHMGWLEGASSNWNGSESRILTWEHNMAQLWDATDGRWLATLDGHIGSTGAEPVWSANGRRLLTWGWDNIVRVWDTVDGHLLTTLVGHTGSVTGAAWNRDEQSILTWSQDETARLWNATDGRELGLLSGHTSRVEGARWNADESRILTWSWDGSARLYYASTLDLQAAACARVSRNLLPSEWAQFMPATQAHHATCDSLPLSFEIEQ
ncbi:MAG: AAA family ATPase [Chloroflexota bacterium]